MEGTGEDGNEEDSAIEKCSNKIRTQDVKTHEQVDFAGLLLSKQLLTGLKSAGFERPSPIQLKAIPLGRCGLDLIVQAKSGTGKTCVFTVVALESIALDSPSTQVLVLAPTREIAVQIWDVINSLSVEMKGLCCYTFIGGMPVANDKTKLKKCHIAVGTPGRVKQLIEDRALATDSIRLFVLDEADKLMEQGFQESINWIYHSLPESKQMLALSATYPEVLAQHLATYMRNPTFVRLNISDMTLLGIRQFYKQVPFHPLQQKAFDEKVKALLELLSQVSFQQCLIFSNYQLRAQSLSDHLNSKGWPATYIMGSQDQEKRLTAMAKLKQFKCRVLISTDLTARGIDAENVNLVINMDMPQDHETYLHRIGRAGRYGTYGAAVSFVSLGKDMANLKTIEKKANTRVLPLPDPVPTDLAKASGFVDIDNLVTTVQLNSTSTLPDPPSDLTAEPRPSESANPATLELAQTERVTNGDTEDRVSQITSRDVQTSSQSSMIPVRNGTLDKREEVMLEKSLLNSEDLLADDNMTGEEKNISNSATNDTAYAEDSIPAMIDCFAEKVQQSFEQVECLLRDESPEEETPTETAESKSPEKEKQVHARPSLPRLILADTRDEKSTVCPDLVENEMDIAPISESQSDAITMEEDNLIPFSYFSLLSNQAAIQSALSTVTLSELTVETPKQSPIMPYETIMDDLKSLRETGKVRNQPSLSRLEDEPSKDQGNTYNDYVQSLKTFMEVMKCEVDDHQEEKEVLNEEDIEGSSDFLKPEESDFMALQKHMHPHRAILDDFDDTTQTSETKPFTVLKSPNQSETTSMKESSPTCDLTSEPPSKQKIVFNKKPKKKQTRSKNKLKLEQFAQSGETLTSDPEESSYRFKIIKVASSEVHVQSREGDRQDDNTLGKEYMKRLTACRHSSLEDDSNSMYEGDTTETTQPSDTDLESSLADIDVQSKLTQKPSGKTKTSRKGKRECVEAHKTNVTYEGQAYLESSWFAPGGYADAPGPMNYPGYADAPGPMPYPGDAEPYPEDSYHQPEEYNTDAQYSGYPWDQSHYPDQEYHQNYPQYQAADPASMGPSAGPYYNHSPYAFPQQLWNQCGHVLNSLQAMQAQSYMWHSQQLAMYHWNCARYMRQLQNKQSKPATRKKKAV